jgi:hypothetical protein
MRNVHAVSPPPINYWPLVGGVGIPVLFAVFLFGAYQYQKQHGFGEDQSYEYLETYGRKHNLPQYGSTS